MPRLKYFLDLISVPSLILSLKSHPHKSLAAESPVHFEPTKLTGMIEEIIGMGTKTRTRILSFGFVHPPKKVRENLGLDENAKVLRIERVAFDTRKRPVEYISILYRSDRYHFNVDFTRKRSEVRAQWDYVES